jgi:WD40 repeat protein
MPGTGKSTLAAMTIRHLQHVFSSQSCQHHFFTESQPTKKSLAYCLRSIAFQVATTHGAFAERLARLHQDVGDALSSQKYQTIWAKVFEGILFKMDIGYTLHWVFDAVDEAENPQMLLKLLSQIQSASCIKVMILSRPNKDIAGVVAQPTKLAVHDTITIRDTSQDIRGYVRTVVTATLPNESHIQTQIIDQIVSRTEGSFLWARLALDTLHHNWHTLGDIQKAMDVIPKDMQSLYRNMLLAVKSQDQRLQDMAQRILTWATCSFRPMKLAELQAALEPEFGGFISLKDTIIQICGHFVRIDGDSVSLIHATARRFLVTPDGNDPEFVSSQDGHEALAQACLQYLSDDRWRRVLSQVPEADSTHKDRLAVLYDSHPLLSYALTCWAYHVRHAPVASPALLQHLKLFFSKHVLCWIQAVALSRSLRTLPLASQYIKLYLKRRKKGQLTSLSPASLTGGISGDSEVHFLERWTVDLIRILGKFGNNLVEAPSSIFKHIPPFCPRDSIVGQFGARQENPLIKVTGISSRIWDDNLARLSVGQDETASKVRCTGVYFLTLVSSNGTVIVWSAETCEELRRLEHGEWVVLLETNATGSAAATSGRFTFKIWDISSGQLLHSITKESQMRPIQIAFGAVERDLVVAYDDCSVVWYDMEAGTEVERFTTEESNKLRGCPRLMVLSPDQSRVAIAFRGRPVVVWETSDASLNPPRRCLRAADEIRSSETDAYNSPEVAVWHPDGESLFILYQDTVIVHWDLVEDERFEFGNTEAREMVISSDGTLLLTCNFSGVLSVWALPKFNLVYRLHGNDFVRDMAFSPDSQRIYDTRGSMCCVWEPDALVRPDDIDRHGDNLSSTLDGSMVSEAVSEPVYSQDSSGSAVTALTYESGGEFYCCGREDGTVSIYDMQKGKISRKVCSHGSNVDVVSLAWSPSGRFLVSGDDMGKIILKRLRLKEDGKWAVFPVFETRLSDGMADQFVFSPDEHMLLISAPSQDQIWDLGTKSMVCQKSRKEERSGQWMNHPFDESRLLLVEQDRIHVYQWRDLKDAVRHSIITTTLTDDSETPRPTSATGSDKVQALAGTNNRRYLVCQVTPKSRKTRSRHDREKNLLSLLLATDLQGPASTPQEQVRRRPLSDLSAHMQSFLGCHRDKVAFIDHGNWYVHSFASLRHFCSFRQWLCQRTTADQRSRLRSL